MGLALLLCLGACNAGIFGGVKSATTAASAGPPTQTPASPVAAGEAPSAAVSILAAGASATPMTEAEGITLAAQDAASDPLGSDARYFSFVYLQSIGLTPKQILTVRKATGKLVNSLSWTPQLVSPAAVDQGSLLLKIHLKDYGWTASWWDAVSAQYPDINSEVPGFSALSIQTGASKPVLRAEWFINNVSLPPLYYTALNLPADFNQLQSIVGIDIGADVRNKAVIRSGFDNSSVSTNDRVAERHALAGNGFLWRTYEFGTKTGNQDVLQSPLGPVRYFTGVDSGNAKPTPGVGGNTRSMFSDDGGEVYFTLPNGMLAFYITDGSDRSLSAVPGAAKGPIFPGYSCMGCHFSGPIAKADMVAPAIAALAGRPTPGVNLSNTDLATVAQLYVSQSLFSAQVKADDAAFSASLAKLGISLVDLDPVSQVVGMNLPEN